MAMALIYASKETDLQDMRMTKKELAVVNINIANKDITTNELGVDKKVVERTLREHKEDVVAAI